MKLILIGLLLTIWIQSFPAYTQTDASTFHKPSSDAVYCLPILKARLLVADALRLRVADSLGNLQSSRIALLESQNKSLSESFANLIKIEQNKFQLQKEISDHKDQLSDSFKGQMLYYQKREKKQRVQNRFLKAGITLAAGFIVYKSVR